MFKTILNNVSSEIVEKKSKFICNVYHIESVEEAENNLADVRKKFHDARHNCFAYRIAEGDISKSSDDGEPSGTAGVPMLNILTGRNLSNILVVVTRYFGGILLGTGGLVRAYSLATTEALDNAELIEEEIGLRASFNVDYKDLDEVKYHMKNREILISDLKYDEKVSVIVEGTEEKIIQIKNGKLSDRIMLKNVDILGKKYVIINKNGKK